jgi:hypothetical protein
MVYGELGRLPLELQNGFKIINPLKVIASTAV